MKKILLAALLCAAAVHAEEAISPAHRALPPTLAKAVAAFDRAQMDCDGAALKRLLADDYVLVNSAGKRENKADFIADYTAPGFSMKPFVVVDELIRVWQGGAVLSGTATLEGTSEGKPFKARLHFADIWREQDGGWQVIYTEARHAP